MNENDTYLKEEYSNNVIELYNRAIEMMDEKENEDKFQLQPDLPEGAEVAPG